MKAASLKGLTLHFGLITGAQVLLMGIFYGLVGIMAALVVGLMHWLIDYSKIRFTGKFKYQSLYFIYDQGLHILTILLMAWLLKPGNSRYEIHLELVAIGVMVIIATYVLTILVQFILCDFCEMNKNGKFFKSFERSMDAITALLLLFIMLNFQLYMLLFVFVIGGVFGVLEHRHFDYSFKVIGVKFIVFISFAVGSGIFF